MAIRQFWVQNQAVQTCVQFPIFQAGCYGCRSDAVRSQEVYGGKMQISFCLTPTMQLTPPFPVTVQLTFHVQAAYHLGSAVSVGYFTHVAAWVWGAAVLNEQPRHCLLEPPRKFQGHVVLQPAVVWLRVPKCFARQLHTLPSHGFAMVEPIQDGWGWVRWVCRRKIKLSKSKDGEYVWPQIFKTDKQT